jgi:hypothetical protein
MTYRSIGLAAALLAGAVLMAMPADAQQARMALGRDFLGYNESHKREAVTELMQGDPSGTNLCVQGKSADDLAAQFTAWMERNPQASNEPLSVAFTRMLEATCGK